MSEYDRYINLPGFENVNRALTLFNVPVDLYRQGDGSVDALANPDNLPTRERVERGIESLVGTAAYGLGPLFARLGGQKATQAISEMLMGFGGSQAAEEVVKDVVQDPSRRKFLAGAAATVPVAALAPDVITDVVTKAAKTGSRAPINPINMAMANIRALKGQIDEKYEILDEMPAIESPNAPEVLEAMRMRDDAEVFIDRSETEIFNEVREVLDEIDPSFFQTASNDALEEIASYRYDPTFGSTYYSDKIDELPNFKTLVNEAKKRGLHTAKNPKGIDEFPNLRTLVEDYTTDEAFRQAGFNVNPSMQMVRETPADIDEDILELKLTELRRQIAQADRVMRVDGKTTKEIDDFKAQKRREMYELQGLPPDMDDFYANGGPVISGVGSLNQTARDMFRGPRGIESLSRFSDGGEAASSDFLNALMELSAQAEAKREEKNKAIALAEQRQKFDDEEEVMSQPLDNSLASTYARAAKMGEDEFMVGVAPTNINPMYQLAMKGDPRGIFGVLPLRDETKTYNIPKFGSIELSGYDDRSLKDVAAGIKKPFIAQAVPDFKDRKKLRSMLSFFAEDLTDEELQQLKRPVLADPMMANKEVLAHEAGHLYDDEFFVKNMDVVYPLYEELLDGYGMEYGDGFVGEYLQELFEPVEASERFTEMGVTDEMRQAAQDYLRRGVLDTDLLSPATIGVLGRLKRLMNEDSKLTTSVRPRPRPSQLN